MGIIALAKLVIKEAAESLGSQSISKNSTRIQVDLREIWVELIVAVQAGVAQMVKVLADEVLVL